jgi:hypothetical protein
VTMLAMLAACLPASDDPVDMPMLVSEVPAPVREAAQQSVRTVHLSPKNPQLAAAARGPAPAGVTVEGNHVTVSVAWVAFARGSEPGFALPARFRDDVVPEAVTVDGAACPVGADGPCALVDGRLWRAGSAPRQVMLEVDAALAAQEAEVRGANAWYGGVSAAAYTVAALGGPVVALQSGAARVTLEAAPAGSALTFVPVRVPSAIWIDDAAPIAFTMKQPDPAGDRVLWSAEIAAGSGPPVRVELDEAARKSWTQWAFTAAGTPAQQLGSVAALASAQLVEAP